MVKNEENQAQATSVTEPRAMFKHIRDEENVSCTRNYDKDRTHTTAKRNKNTGRKLDPMN